MLTKFWEGVGSKLAERWVTTVLTPAFAFWLGGIIAWGWHSRTSLNELIETHLGNDASVSPDWLPVVLGLLVVAGSAALVQTFGRSILRLLEGYWWPVTRTLRDALVARQSNRAEKDHKRFQELQSKGLENLTRAEYEEYVRRDVRLSHTPSDSSRRMPTRLGNILRAAELHSEERYGLNAIVCWPHLWLVLPDPARAEVAGAMSQLETAVRWLFWSFLFLVWTFWAWWAVLVATVLGFFAYRMVIDSAEAYADLFRSLFDLYRFDLYQGLRCLAPSNPSEDKTLGEALTRFLWRGSDADTPPFIHEAE